jgi:hypothetical protein
MNKIIMNLARLPPPAVRLDAVLVEIRQFK